MSSHAVRSTATAPIEPRALVTLACQRAGFPTGARLLRHFSNAVYLLDTVPVVAKVACSPGGPERSRTAVAVARWLTSNGFPATTLAELPSGGDQPISLDWQGYEVAVTFWRQYPQPVGEPPPDSRSLGRIAAQLHRSSAPQVALPTYEPLDALDAALAGPANPALGPAQRDWLLRRSAELQHNFRQLDFPLGHGFIHADLVGGNLLWNTATGRHGLVLGDWDTACIGPREIDLIATHHQPRYGSSLTSVRAFTAEYGYDLSGWHGYPILLQIRELSTLAPLIHHARVKAESAAELQHRLATLSHGDRTTHWHAQ